MKYSVTSVSLPDLDVAETCALLQELGYDGVEWRVRYVPDQAKGQGFNPWGEHKTDLSPANIGARAGEVARITADYGLEIAAIAANLRCDEYEEVKRLAEGVAKMGRIPIRLGAPDLYDRSQNYNVLYQRALDAYAKALDILRPYGLPALIEIHGGTLMVSASLAHRICSQFPPEEMGVIYDINNMSRDGFETFRLGMELLGPYLQHVHAGGWRPVARDRQPNGWLKWEFEGCDLADGYMDVPQFMEDLKAVRYQRFITIEDFRDMDHREKLGPQITFLKGLE